MDASRRRWESLGAVQKLIRKVGLKAKKTLVGLYDGNHVYESPKVSEQRHQSAAVYESSERPWERLLCSKAKLEILTSLFGKQGTEGMVLGEVTDESTRTGK